LTISLTARIHRKPHLRATVSALSRLHAVFFPTSLLLFNGLEDFLMTRCDFEQQATLFDCQENIDQHDASHRVRGTATMHRGRTPRPRTTSCHVSSTARFDIPVRACEETAHVRPRDLESHTTCSSRLYDRENEVAVGYFRLLPRLKSA
jgi:hypothetical protein